jgi:hypothetical protein
VPPWQGILDFCHPGLSVSAPAVRFAAIIMAIIQHHAIAGRRRAVMPAIRVDTVLLRPALLHVLCQRERVIQGFPRRKTVLVDLRHQGVVAGPAWWIIIRQAARPEASSVIHAHRVFLPQALEEGW